jgi:hypothetical protein
MAEELGLEQRVGQGPAALGHERLGTARAIDVDEVGEELLAGAGLTEEEHRRVSVEDLARELDRGSEPGVGADEAVERRRLVAARRCVAPEGVVGHLELVAQPGILPGEAPALGGPAHDEEQLVGIPGLGDEMVDPSRVDRLHEVVDVSVRGQHDPDRVRRLLLAAPQQLDPGHPGHAVVGHDDRHLRLGGETGEGLLAVAGPQHPELGGEDRLERVEHARLIVHDQDRRLVHEASGRGGRHVDARAASAGSRRPQTS